MEGEVEEGAGDEVDEAGMAVTSEYQPRAPRLAPVMFHRPSKGKLDAASTHASPRGFYLGGGE